MSPHWRRWDVCPFEAKMQGKQPPGNTLQSYLFLDTKLSCGKTDVRFNLSHFSGGLWMVTFIVFDQHCSHQDFKTSQESLKPSSFCKSTVEPFVLRCCWMLCWESVRVVGLHAIFVLRRFYRRSFTSLFSFSYKIFTRFARSILLYVLYFPIFDQEQKCRTRSCFLWLFRQFRNSFHLCHRSLVLADEYLA